MAKNPKKPEEIFPEFIGDYKGLFGDDLISILLVGSAASPNYQPGKSDINFMIVLSEEGIENLDLAFKTVQKWRKRNVAVPLFLTEGYITSSLDVFPVEYINYQRNYALVFGKDVLKDMEFNAEFVRLQCEREIKGKLLLLRQAYLESGGAGKALKAIIGQSITAVVSILKALLHLKAVEPHRHNREVIRAAAGTFDIRTDVLEKILDVKQDKIKPGREELRKLFKDYLSQVRKLSKIADKL